MMITWVVYDRVEQIEGRLVSNLASVRYRLIIPAGALAIRGHRANVLQLGVDSRQSDAIDSLAGEAVVFTKPIFPGHEGFPRVSELTLEVLAAARRKGMSIVTDFSDNHFENPSYGKLYRDLANAADLVVASTTGMAHIARAYTARPVHAITDPYEGARREPRFRPAPPRPAGLLRRVLSDLVTGTGRRPLRLLWFGHGSNLGSVVDLLPPLRRLVHRYAVDLHIVTSPDTGAADLCGRFDRDSSPALQVRFSPWSMETTWRALETCDLVIIPARLHDPSKTVKSPNRLVESIWAGRFVCANAVASYEEFADFAWLGDDVVSGIEWAVQHPREAMHKLAAGQDYIARHYSPEAIARQWEAALIAARESGEPARQGGPLLKLNLGCGDKILPGFVNVDVAESRGDARPDVLCDLHHLKPFADGIADEVLSVHVIEHFWRWEAVEVLKEWARVLRPGGRMILECPNLLSACQEFVRNPDLASGPGREGQRTMWVFYGDPAWHDPLMVHRWGYTPESLARVMAEAGLVNVRVEPAQFKLREPRDMRLVGEKAA